MHKFLEVSGRSHAQIPQFIRHCHIHGRFAAFLAFISVTMAIYVLVPELFGDGKTKDYPLWYEYAQRAWGGDPLYDSPRYLYPSTMALLLAPFSQFGTVVFYSLLIAGSVLALVLCVCQAQTLSAGHTRLPSWLAAVPSVMVLPQIVENLDLGQPHMVLLAILLGGFLCLRQGQQVLAGAMFALAAAIKVFPLTVLPYLVWRRQWRAVFSLITVLLLVLVVLPSPLRGFDRNLNEIGHWFVSMMGDEDGFGQRETQNWSWKNQSVVALTHRLVRPINYRAVNGDGSVGHMNLIEVEYRTANLILAGVVSLLGLAFLAVMLPRRRLNHKRLAEELGILTCLMIIGSPLARTYYFVWLLFPLTVIVQRAWDAPQPEIRRALTVGLTLVFMVSLLQAFDWAQAYGNNTVATLMVAAMLGWLMRRGNRTQ